ASLRNCWYVGLLLRARRIASPSERFWGTPCAPAATGRVATVRSARKDRRVRRRMFRPSGSDGIGEVLHCAELRRRQPGVSRWDIAPGAALCRDLAGDRRARAPGRGGGVPADGRAAGGGDGRG